MALYAPMSATTDIPSQVAGCDDTYSQVACLPGAFKDLFGLDACLVNFLGA